MPIRWKYSRSRSIKGIQFGSEAVFSILYNTQQNRLREMVACLVSKTPVCRTVKIGGGSFQAGLVFQFGQFGEVVVLGACLIDFRLSFVQLCLA